MLLLLSPTIKDPQLKTVWETFDFVWGNPSSESNAGALSALNSDMTSSTTPMLSIADGVAGTNNGGSDGVDVPPDGPAADEGSVTTTEPEPTPDESYVDPTEIEDGEYVEPMFEHGLTDEEWEKFSKKYPTLARPGNCDGIQPENLSPPPPSPSPPAALALSCMGPPAPLSPATLERKKQVQERLVELRWGALFGYTVRKTNDTCCFPFLFLLKRCSI